MGKRKTFTHCRNCGVPLAAGHIGSRCQPCISKANTARTNCGMHSDVRAAKYDWENPGAREALHKRIAERRELERRYGIHELKLPGEGEPSDEESDDTD